MALTSHAIQVDGVARRFLLAAGSTAPSTIVFSLHGSRSGPANQARLSGMEALTEQGAVICFPQGSVPSGSGFEWDLDVDEEFLRATVAALRDQFPSAQKRVCMTGMSGGARMSSRFAARHPDTVMVLGAVAGLRAENAGTLERPVRVVAFHGTADRINPFGGSGTVRWDESVTDAAKAWARANGHVTEAVQEQVTPKVTRLDFGAEDEPGAVTLWVCRGAGHTWPGSRLPILLRLFLGQTTHEVDATAEIWRAAQVGAA
ncbi:MAG: alpha/beta hydrolase family esterase [Acidimicrobiales bacterium]